MSEIIALDDVEITGIEDHPPDTSVKLHGPPGTGKTTQSAARVGRLLRDYDYQLSDVAWCTYRTQLAQDTLKRFVHWDLIDENALERPHEGATRFIATTHAVANRTVGSLPDPAEPWHKADFCDRMGMQFWTQHPWDDSPGQLLFRIFDWLCGNRLDPAKPGDVRECPITEDLYEQWQGGVPEAWNRWEDLKAQRDLIDFHEMLTAPIDERATPTEEILVIDEYHDANPLMAELCEFWMDTADIVIVAGDPHQVVNAYDGADPRFFNRVDLPEVLLDITYRVPEEHWCAATGLLEEAHDAPPVTRNSHGTITEYKSPTFERTAEGGWNTSGMNADGSPGQLINNHGEDMLFLARTQMQADGVGAALEDAGVLYYSQSDLNGWNTESAEDRLAIFNGLQKIRGFTPGDFDTGYGLAQYTTNSPAQPAQRELTHTEAAALLTITNAKHLAQSRSDTTEICEELEDNETAVTLTEFNTWVKDQFWSHHTAGARSVRELNKGALSDRDRTALMNALHRYDRWMGADDIEAGVLTIHAAKGQEAEDVVVYDGVTRRIQREMDSKEQTRKNEWRTWYVALTRASKRLHIMREGFGWTHPIIPNDIRHSVAQGLAAEGASGGSVS